MDDRCQAGVCTAGSALPIPDADISSYQVATGQAVIDLSGDDIADAGGSIGISSSEDA
ncbi:MAG TPA: hypothetical protein VGC79_19030 [Polyangiaceae bacterium]